MNFITLQDIENGFGVRVEHVDIEEHMKRTAEDLGFCIPSESLNERWSYLSKIKEVK
jgi:hypothetical protein